MSLLLLWLQSVVFWCSQQGPVKTLKRRNRGLRILPSGFSYAAPSLGIKELLVSPFVRFCGLKG